MSKKVKLLMLMLCVMSLMGCKNAGNSSEGSSGENTVGAIESETLGESLEAIVENLMPQDDMVTGASVFVTSENDMIGVLTEPFDKDYYVVDSHLREMVTEDLETFNEAFKNQYGIKNAMACEGLGLLNGYAVLSLRFSEWNAYVEYMASDIYAETDVTVADLSKKETLKDTFVSFEGEATEASVILDETKKQQYHIIKAIGDITIYLERPIAYVSVGTEVIDEYTVKSSDEGIVIITK